MTDAETLHRLEAAMFHLKRKTREVFLAHRLDGMSYVEIAEQTGQSLRRIEKHITVAIVTVDRELNRP